MSIFPPSNRFFRGSVSRILICAGIFIFAGIVLAATTYVYTAKHQPPPSTGWARDQIQYGDLFTIINSDQKLYVLSTYDRGLYENIFAAQKAHDWQRANNLIKRLHDKTLVGHVLFDRYINSGHYKADYSELQKWMSHYGDHPEAYKVYQLAQKRRHNDPTALPAPQIAKKLLGSLEFAWLSKETAAEKTSARPSKRNAADIRQLMTQVKSHLHNDRVTQAYNLLGRSKASAMLSNIEYDSLLSNIAAGYFYNGKYDTAYKISLQAAKRSNRSAPYAHWIAGLSAWKNKDYQASSRHFKSVVLSHSRNQWMLSAAAFWAARSYERLGDHNTSSDWLHEAASYPRTFYGLIAQQKLGGEATFSWEAPQFSNTLIDTLRATPSGKRALALLDIGQEASASMEFGQINPNGNRRIEKALIAAAHQFNMPSLALRLGNAVHQPDGKLYDVALYPVVPWKGDTRIGINPALTNALIRQESQFSPQAQNKRSGATGLMQLMPRTAQFVSDKSYPARDLHKPEVNIVLGQRYIKHLLNLPQVKGNLLYLAAAYNAGPGNLGRWVKTMDYNDDPFMFVESIPISETRAFVERVLTNYWIYNQRLKQDAGTLTSISKDAWPIYPVKPDMPGLQLAAY